MSERSIVFFIICCCENNPGMKYCGVPIYTKEHQNDENVTIVIPGVFMMAQLFLRDIFLWLVSFFLSLRYIATYDYFYCF